MTRVTESQKPTGKSEQRHESEDDACDAQHSTSSASWARPGPLAWLVQLPIRLYRLVIGPLLPPSCRFYPSCSAYALEALARHGAVKGSVMTLCRLGRCGPWHPGGLDPVPDRFSVRAQRSGSSIEE